MRRWLKFQLRKYLKPMDKLYANSLRQRLAAIYLLIAWNTAGYLIYCCIKNAYPMTEKEEKRPTLWYMRLLGVDNAEIIQYNALSKKQHLKYENYGETISPILSEESEEIK